MADLGVDFGAPQVNIDKLRSNKEKVIGKLTGGLAAMAKMRKVTTVRGYGNFVGANHLEVEETSGTSARENRQQESHRLQARHHCGRFSQAVRLSFMPNDPRVVDSAPARLELKEVPKRMLILGGGIIGLEMGTVYSTLGARLDVVEMMDGLMQGADRDLVKIWQKMNAKRFRQHHAQNQDRFRTRLA
jgi:dihydrolipoamide dehydrogenase